MDSVEQELKLWISRNDDILIKMVEDYLKGKTMSKMIEIDGVELSVDTVKSALKKAGVKLEKKVDWRTLDLGTVVENDCEDRAIVYFNEKSNKEELLLISGSWEDEPETADGVESDFDNCKVIGRIKFVVEEI